MRREVSGITEVLGITVNVSNELCEIFHITSISELTWINICAIMSLSETHFGALMRERTWRIENLEPLEIKNHDIPGSPRRPTEFVKAPDSEEFGIYEVHPTAR